MLWAYVAAVLGKYGIYKPMTQHGVDFTKHWYAAHAILEGVTPYEGKPHLWLGYNYPQWTALVTFWLAYLDIKTAEILWKSIGLLLVVACWWIAWRVFKPDLSGAPGLSAQSDFRIQLTRAMHGHWALTTAVLVAAFAPAGASSLHIGQSDPINAFLAMALVAALLTGRERLGGVYWAMLCLVKSVPVFLILPVLFWRRWRMLQGWLFFMAGYALMLLITGRLMHEWFFVSDVTPLIPFRWRGISVAIPRAILLAFFPESWHDTPAIYETFIKAGMLITLAAMALIVYMARRRGLGFLRVLETSLLFLPFLTPLLENHHFVWVMPVLFLHLQRWLRGDFSLSMTAVLVVGWAVVMLDYFAYNLLAHTGFFGKFFSVPGGLLLLGASVYEIFRARPEDSTTSEWNAQAAPRTVRQSY